MAERRISFYGASPGESQANRIALQSAVDALQTGDDLIIDVAGCVFPKPTPVSTYMCYLLDKADFWIVSENGAVLTVSPSDAALNSANHFLKFKDCSNITISGVSLDGSKANSGMLTTYNPNFAQHEHQKGLFFENTSDVNVLNCTIQNFMGDAVNIYHGSRRHVYDTCTVRWMQRDGITLNGLGVGDVTIKHCILHSCSNQEIDNEHAAIGNVEVHSCKISSANQAIGPDLMVGDTSCLGKVSIALAANNEDPIGDPSRDWWIHHNEINGPIFVFAARDVRIEHNTGTNYINRGWLEINRSAQVTLRGNVARNVYVGDSPGDADGYGMVVAKGTEGTGNAPELTMIDNVLTIDHPSAHGVMLMGFASAQLQNNDIRGAGVASAGTAGVWMRTTVENRPVVSVRLVANRVRDFGARGVSVHGNGTASIRRAELIKNTFANTMDPASMTTGLRLDDGTGALKTSVVAQNIMGAGVTTGIANAPAGSMAIWTISW